MTERTDITGLTAKDIISTYTLEHPLNFTRHFFKTQNGRGFVVGEHHKLICDKLQQVLEGKCNRLIINIAPRYGKTEIAVKNFIAMGLAINPAANFIHLSYSGNLALDNSESIKNIVKSDEYQRLYDTRIRRGSDSKSAWSTEQGGGVYATSTLGQITGFGAGAVDEPGKPYKFSGAIVIDDPLKAQDALSDVVRESVNLRFETTIRSRVNSRNTPIIIIMQRLHENDLCGYLMKKEPGAWDILELPCITTDEQGNEKPLWEFKHTLEELHKIAATNSFVFETQYMQHPTPLEGLMYPHLKTYETLPIKAHLPKHKNYTDTADTGQDYLCSICYDEYTDGECYVTDILFTKKGMEYTEPETARMLVANRTEYVKIEANNGGRGFARNVESHVRNLGDRRMTFSTFSQTKNKNVRIFSHSAEVMNMVYFPVGWQYKWAEFYESVIGYRKEGKNIHDDAEDALTGIVESLGINFAPLTAEEESEMEDLIY